MSKPKTKTKATVLTRDEILAAIERRNNELELIDVPEWGGRMFLRRLTVPAVDATGFFDATGTDDRMASFRQLIVASVVDESGTPLLNADDAAALADADMSVFTRVFDKIASLNDLEGIKDVTEQVERNAQELAPLADDGADDGASEDADA